MTRQESFEVHWADMHDIPVETLAQYRWKDQDGYRLPGISAGYRNFCAGWDAAKQPQIIPVKIKITPTSEERLRKEIANLTDPMTVQGPRYE